MATRSMYVGEVMHVKAVLSDVLGTEYTAATVAGESFGYDVGDTTGAITMSQSGLTATVTAVYPTTGAYLTFDCEAVAANGYQSAVPLSTLLGNAPQTNINVLGATQLDPHALWYDGEAWIEWTLGDVVIPTSQIGCTANGSAWKLLKTYMRPLDARGTALDITTGRGATYSYTAESSDITILDLTYDQQEDGWYFRPKKPGTATIIVNGTPTLTTPGSIVTGTLVVKISGILGCSLVEYTP